MSRAFALLGSGEFEPWTEPIDRELLRRSADMGAGSGRVLVLPAASAPEGDEVFDRWAEMGLEHYARLRVPAEVVPIKTREDADRLEFTDRLGDASIVYFSGGNPAYLARVLAGTAFWRAVLERMQAGLAFVGCSAGVACLGEVAPDSAGTSLEAERFRQPGLRLFPNTVFGPHWDALNRFLPGLQDIIVSQVPTNGRLLAIDERTAVLGDGVSWTVVGSGGAGLYENGAWSHHASGDWFSLPMLRPDPTGSVPVE